MKELVLFWNLSVMAKDPWRLHIWESLTFESGVRIGLRPARTEADCSLTLARDAGVCAGTHRARAQSLTCPRSIALPARKLRGESKAVCI